MNCSETLHDEITLLVPHGADVSSSPWMFGEWYTNGILVNMHVKVSFASMLPGHAFSFAARLSIGLVRTKETHQPIDE